MSSSVVVINNYYNIIVAQSKKFWSIDVVAVAVAVVSYYCGIICLAQFVFCYSTLSCC